VGDSMRFPDVDNADLGMVLIALVGLVGLGAAIVKGASTEVVVALTGGIVGPLGAIARSDKNKNGGK